MENKKVTIEDILKAKKLIDERKNAPFYSETFSGEIEIEDVPAEKVLSIINSANPDEPLRGDYELIYECCPIFRARELQENYGIKEPVEIIEKCFGGNIQEIDSLAKHIMKRYGFFTGEIEAVKKQ